MGPAKTMLAFARAARLSARSSSQNRFGRSLFFSSAAQAHGAAASTPGPSPALSRLSKVSLKDFTRIATAAAGSRLGQRQLDIDGRASALSLSSAQFDSLLRNVGYTGDTGAVFAELVEQTGATPPTITVADMRTLYQTPTYTAEHAARKALVAKIVSTFESIDTDGSVSSSMTIGAFPRRRIIDHPRSCRAWLPVLPPIASPFLSIGAVCTLGCRLTHTHPPTIPLTHINHCQPSLSTHHSHTHQPTTLSHRATSTKTSSERT